MRLAAPLVRAGAVIRVATVDHGLRRGSASDAEFVAAEAAALGLSAAVLRWEGEKPATGVQAAARSHRYRLLAAEAARIGADAILTGHTADDQAETLLMRMAHRTGPRGLAGMAPESLIADGAEEPQRLIRLLLGERRAALRDYLAAAGARFVEDPSNEELRFERVRVRRMVEALPNRDAVIAGLVDLSARARRLQEMADRIEALQFSRAGGVFYPDGSIGLAAHVDLTLAARLLQAAGASDHAPDGEAAAAALTAVRSGRRATLAGAVIEPFRDGVIIRREPAAVLGRGGERAASAILLSPGRRVLWDRRFVVENIFKDAVEVRALGATASALAGFPLPGLEAAPGLFIKGGLAAFPGDCADGETAVRSLIPERFARAVIRF